MRSQPSFATKPRSIQYSAKLLLTSKNWRTYLCNCFSWSPFSHFPFSFTSYSLILGRYERKLSVIRNNPSSFALRPCLFILPFHSEIRSHFDLQKKNNWIVFTSNEEILYRVFLFYFFKFFMDSWVRHCIKIATVRSVHKLADWSNNAFEFRCWDWLAVSDRGRSLVSQSHCFILCGSFEFWTRIYSTESNLYRQQNTIFERLFWALLAFPFWLRAREKLKYWTARK